MDAPQSLEQAMLCFSNQDYRGAETHLLQAIDQSPDREEARYHLANLYRFLERQQDAIRTLTPLLAKREPSASYRWLLFELYQETGDLDSTGVILDRFKLESDLTSDQLDRLLDVARQAGQYQKAIEIARTLQQKKAILEIQITRWLSRLLNLLPAGVGRSFIQFTATIYRKQSRRRIARVLLESAWNSKIQSAEWAYQLGHLARESRDIYKPEWHREKNWYELALRLDPTYQPAHSGIDQVLFDMKSWKVLLRRIDNTSDRHQNTIVLRQRAAAYTELKEYTQALELYRQLSISGDDRFASLCQCLIRMENQEYHEALQTLEAINQPRELTAGIDILIRFFYDSLQQMLADTELKPVDGITVLEKMDRDYIVSTNNHPIVNPASFPCFLCGTQGARTILWKDTITGWERARCHHCSMISVYPVPSSEDIMNFYRKEGRKELSIIKKYRSFLLEVLDSSVERCKQLPTYREVTDWGADFSWTEFEESIQEPKSSLDIGCSAGRTVAMFQKMGWSAHGIDLDPEAIQFGQSHGLRVRSSSIGDLISNREKYHLITLIDVIEHVVDPKQLLEEIKQLMTPGAVLYIKTPAADSLPHRFIGDAWLESAEHLQFFSRHTLQRLLSDCGFELLAFHHLMEESTPLVHYSSWQGHYFPTLLERWIERFEVGDSIRILVRKPR